MPLFFTDHDLPSVLSESFAIAPATQQFIKYYPNLFGWSRSLQNNFTVVAVLASVAFMFFSIFVVSTYLVTYCMLLTNKSLSAKTEKLQLMLHKALGIQLIFFCIFGIFPAYALFIIYITHLSFGSFLFPFGMAFGCCHCIFEMLSMIYLIKPYRSFVQQIIVNFLVLVKIRKNTHIDIHIQSLVVVDHKLNARRMSINVHANR